MVKLPTKRELLKIFPLNRMNTKNFLFEKTISMRTGAKFRVNQRMLNPVICTELGNILSKKLKDYIKSSDIDNSYTKCIPTFEYETKDINAIAERNKVSAKIFLKFSDKKRPTSYIVWHKGVIHISEGNNTLMVAHMIRFMYLVIKRDHPYILRHKGPKTSRTFNREINYSNNNAAVAESTIDSRQRKGEEYLKKLVAL